MKHGYIGSAKNNNEEKINFIHFGLRRMRKSFNFLRIFLMEKS